ncbi:MAG: zinc ribbon domain-containing protein [Planctomycetes bacterium]|nr:zinc ribbon domain-containing protein [Planctomycetota bacterium]
MPTYDYACSACGHRFEHFQSFSEARLVTCPKCGRKKLERLIGSGSGIVFKGSGFYETDYKRAGKPASESSDGKPAKGGDSAGTPPAASPSDGGSGGSGGSSGGGGKPGSGDS